MRELPDPKDAVDTTARDEGEYGIFRDQMADGVASAHTDKMLLEDMYVQLDTILDDVGLYPGEVHNRGREAQKAIKELSEWMDEYRRAMHGQAQMVTEMQEKGGD